MNVEWSAECYERALPQHTLIVCISHAAQSILTWIYSAQHVLRRYQSTSFPSKGALSGRDYTQTQKLLLQQLGFVSEVQYCPSTPRMMAFVAKFFRWSSGSRMATTSRAPDCRTAVPSGIGTE